MKRLDVRALRAREVRRGAEVDKHSDVAAYMKGRPVRRMEQRRVIHARDISSDAHPSARFRAEVSGERAPRRKDRRMKLPGLRVEEKLPVYISALPPLCPG